MAKETKLQFVDCRDFTPGLNTLDDPIDIDKGATPYVLNMDINKRGKLLSRFGYEEVCSFATGIQMRGIQAYYRTYDDDSSPIDQQSGASGQTYTLPISISEAATDKLSFTPSSITKNRIIQIAIIPKVTGTGDWTLTLHDSSNNLLAAQTIPNTALTINIPNFFRVPYVWTSGALHFHLTSTVNDGTLQTSTLNDLSTAAFQERYSTISNHLLIFTSDGNFYSISATDTTPTLINTWGTDHGVPVRGTTFLNNAYFSDGGAGNTIRSYNANVAGNFPGNPPPANIFEVFQKRLFTAGDPSNTSKANYTDTDTTDNLAVNFESITLGDGTDITALIKNNDALQVFKTETINAINFSFDASYNLTLPQQQPIINSQGGVWATDSVQAIYGYTYYMSSKGFETYGPTQQRITADQPLPLSLEIEPTFKTINMQYTNAIHSAFFDNKYLCTAALNSAKIPTNIFVYNESIKRRFGKDNWTVYEGIPAAGFAKFKNTKKIDELYFISSVNPKVYKFNNTFSDAGSAYKKLWTSKTFTFGERTNYFYIDFEGVMTLNAVIDLRVFTDDQTAQDTITKNNLISGGIKGSYIGDGYVGDSYVGGGYTGSATPLYKFKKRYYFPQNVNWGYSMYFQLLNNQNNAGWGLNRYVLAYGQDPESPTYERTT